MTTASFVLIYIHFYAMNNAPQKPELAIVMPVYNEEACIERVISAWAAKLTELNVPFKMIILNDGSTDNTGAILDKISDDRFEIVHKANSGHGPTILEGYKRALRTADWIFHCDSDGEISPDYFKEFWYKKYDKDFIIGVRQKRNQPILRKFITFIARFLVNLIYLNGLHDVNCPYRLMHRQFLHSAINEIPEDTFAPNVILSGLLVKSRAKVLEIPVINDGRTSGEVSLKSFNALKKSALAFWQTLVFRFKH